MHTAWTARPALAKLDKAERDNAGPKRLPYATVEEMLQAMRDVANTESRARKKQDGATVSVPTSVSDQTLKRIVAAIKGGASTYDEITSVRNLTQSTVERGMGILIAQGKVRDGKRRGHARVFEISPEVTE